MFGRAVSATERCSTGRMLGSGSVGSTSGAVTSGNTARMAVAGTATTAERRRRAAASTQPTIVQAATTTSIGSRAVYATRTTSPDNMMPMPNSVCVKLSTRTSSSHPPTPAAGTAATALPFGKTSSDSALATTCASRSGTRTGPGDSTSTRNCPPSGSADVGDGFVMKNSHSLNR